VSTFTDEVDEATLFPTPRPVSKKLGEFDIASDVCLPLDIIGACPKKELTGPMEAMRAAVVSFILFYSTAMKEF